MKLLPVSQTCLNQLYRVGQGFLEKNNNIAAESAKQDQTAHTCSLILLYTLRKTI